jgi:hypothetical protein
VTKSRVSQPQLPQLAENESRASGTPLVTALRQITEAITIASSARSITPGVIESRQQQTHRSGNHAGNHGNHAAGNHERSPLYERGSVRHATDGALHLNDEDKERLARSADERIKASIEAARRRAELQRQTRAEFSASRAAGLRARHAAKIARNRLALRHHGRRGA